MRREGKNPLQAVQMVLYIKVVLTAALWAGPALLTPQSLIDSLGLPGARPVFFRVLLGVAYLALTVVYIIGIIEVRRSRFPFTAVLVGIVSNAGACLVLLAAGAIGDFAQLPTLSRALLLGSAGATGAIALALVITGGDGLRAGLPPGTHPGAGARHKPTGQSVV